VQNNENKALLKDYTKILKTFQTSSNPLSLNIPFEYIQRIQKETNLEKILDSIPRKYKISLDEMKAYKTDYNKYPLIETVTFHPSYAYQDFVEGISVETTPKNQIIYSVKDGIFKKICDRAIANPTYKYILLIDEINRGDISSIFGELFTLLEDSKRKDEEEEMSINLPYSKDDKGNPKKLTVPNNLHIVATMNTVDKSIALIDVALRRRFDFEECMPQYNLEEFTKYKETNNIDLSILLKSMNERITILKNEHYQIGHSYFLNIKTIEALQKVMRKNIIPLLQEYFYDDWESICAVLNQSYKFKTKNFLFDITDGKDNKAIFDKEFDHLIEHQNKKIFISKKFLIKDEFDTKLFLEAIKSIYTKR